MLKLRGHHLICLHFFNGEGYDTVFVDNLTHILKRTEDEPVEVSWGADDVCLKCPHLDNSICRYGEVSEKEVREMDKKALHLLGLHSGSRIAWNEIERKMPFVFHQWFKDYCGECDWIAACRKSLLFNKINTKLTSERRVL